MRGITVAGNWKMNLNLKEAEKLFKALNDEIKKSDKLEQVLIFPAFPFLFPLKSKLNNDSIQLGSQNIASEDSGAFTGEVSASMIKSLGIDYALIGHSERRVHFNENEAVLKKKMDQAIANKLTPIFCCGESLFDRRNGKHEIVIEHQLRSSVFHLDTKQIEKIIIAYEPVWAIGTGETASSAQAEEMHAFIRRLINETYNKKVADSIPILYGGSCNANNAKELFGCPNVDGGLIGGASLKLDEFLKIISLVDE